MGIRILWQDIWTKEVPIVEGMEAVYPLMEEKLFAKLLRPDSDLEIRHLPRSSYMVMSPYLAMLNNVELVNGIIQGEKDGFDVAIIGCGNDPGLYEARNAASIPVVGPTETSMHLACQLASRFAVITIIEQLVPIVERNLRLYGLEERAISHKPVRSCDVGFEFPKWFESPEDHILEPFERTAKECVRDGAEAIVVACCGLGPALTLAGYKEVGDTGAPVLDVATVAVKHAEFLAEMHELGISKSNVLTYLSIPTEIVDEFARPFFTT